MIISLQLAPATLKSWNNWMQVVNGRAHIGFEVLDADPKHMDLSLQCQEPTIARVEKAWSKDQSPESVLDIGSSAGLKAFVLQKRWPRAQVAGIDPDNEAIAVGRALADDPWMHTRIAAERMPNLKVASAEALPWPDASFDLIVCITVLEHVADVAKSVAEMARVLKPGGVAYIEAPNYLWPVEGHLQIIVPPLAPKWIMRLCARLQGQAKHAAFVNHLQLVHPAMLERLFRANGLAFTNETLAKLDAAASGDTKDVVAYRRAARLLGALRKFGLAGPLARLIGHVGIYPSMIYRAEKS
jgi:ubiquinone/menaquinone biosynthesis C-methylase UbiE